MLVTSIDVRVVTNLNNIPTENKISSESSPLIIVVGCPSSDYNALTSIPFGSYAQVNKGNDPKNDN